MGIEVFKTNVLIWWLLTSTAMNVAIHLEQIHWTFGSTQEHKLPETSKFIECHSKIEYWTIKLRFSMWHRLIRQFFHGRDLQLLQSRWLPTTQISFCAWYQIIQKRIKGEKIKLKIFDSPILTENYLELMEDRLSSRRIFSRTCVILAGTKCWTWGYWR